MAGIKRNPFLRKVKKWFGRESYYRLQLEQWLASIDVASARVLDIGGGLNPVKGRTKSWRVADYRMLDNNLEGDFQPDFVLDINAVFSPTGKDAAERVRKYQPETIFCLEVMEYVFDPLSVLRFIHGILSPGGVAYMSFPSLYPVHEPVEHDCLRYTKHGIVKLLQASGFTRFDILARRATKGKDDWERFCRSEKMKAAQTDTSADIGYMVTAYQS